MKYRLNKESKPVGYSLSNPDVQTLWDARFLLSQLGRVAPEIAEFGEAFEAVIAQTLADRGKDLSEPATQSTTKTSTKKPSAA